MPRASAVRSAICRKSVVDLKDDPFPQPRWASSAGWGGFAKDTTPFSEFLWADFLRRKLSRKAIDANFDKAAGESLGSGEEQGRDLSAGLVRGRRRTIRS